MKKIILLFLIINYPLQSQTKISKLTKETLLENLKANEVLENNKNNFNTVEAESIFLNGEIINSSFGYSISNAGDVNGDGYIDIIVGACAYDNYKGRAYIFYGGIIIDTVPDIIFTGESPGDYFGISVSSADDVNGDGYSDVIVGADQAIGTFQRSGRAYIYYGGTSMNNTADVILSGSGESIYNHFGHSVSNTGDVNGDGFSDVIVGAYGQYYINHPYTGKAYIFYGGNSMNNQVDVSLYGERTGGEDVHFGISVSKAGDVNGDGYSDVIVGATGYDYDYGRAYIYYGSSLMNNVADITMSGYEFRGRFGNSVSYAGDVNGDGYSDVIIGQYTYQGSSGRAHIFYGGLEMDNVVDVTMSTTIPSILFGLSVSAAGDVNGDGYSDVMVGTVGDNRVYIYYGSFEMNNVVDVILTGNNSFGHSVSTIGDINRDGYSDVIISTPTFNEATGQVCICTNITPKPLLVFPVENSIYNSLTINFQWKKLSSTIYYVLIVSPDSLFNNIIFNDTLQSDTSNSVNGFEKGVKYYWKVRSKDSSGFTINSSTWNFTTIPPLWVNLKLLFEGMFSPSYNQMIREDSVSAYLRTSSPPFSITDSAKVGIDSVSFTGLLKFSNALTGTYYISIKHLNSIETWSKIGGELLVNDYLIYNYDFTTAKTQAFGNNLKLKGSKYCMYSGDVNQDGFISLFDVIPIYNDATNFRVGNYLATDLTGEGIVDLTDITICYNNSANFVSIKRP